MENTFKSLLITTVLTLPTAFGADALQGVVYETTKEKHLVSQSAEVSATEDSLRLCGEVFANMMRLIPDSHPQIEPLGHLNVDDLPSTPQTLYDYFRIFERSLSRASLSDADSSSLRTHIQNSSYFNEYAKDLLISAMPDATPKEIARGIEVLFDDVRFQGYLVNDVNCPSLVADAKRLCNRLQAHNDSKPEDIYDLAIFLNNPRQKNYEIVIFSYELYALHRDATPSEITTAAFLIKSFGANYYDRAAILFEMVANRTDATPSNIMNAATGLYSLGEAYYDRAAILFEMVANRTDATPSNIMNAATGLKSLGEAYYDRAASIYLNAANHRDASADVISKIISKIEQIRDTYPTDSAAYKKHDGIISELRTLKESRSK